MDGGHGDLHRHFRAGRQQVTRKYWVSCRGEMFYPIYAPNKREALRFFRKHFGWERLPVGTECGLV